MKTPLPGSNFAKLYAELGPAKDRPGNLPHEIYENLWYVMRKLKHSDFLSEEQGRITLKFLGGENVFGVMPTSSGKSFTFQTVARVSNGLTVVITPLTALARDQVRHSPDGMAQCYNSAMTAEQKKKTKQLIKQGKLKLLFISPEQLKSSGFRDILDRGLEKVQRFVIDEAHCVIQWGYGFRVKYLHIGREIKEFEKKLGAGKQIPVLLLTATATPDLQQEIADNLQIKIPPENFITKVEGADRPELIISKKQMAHDRRKLAWIAKQLKPGGDFHGRRGIIFSAFATGGEKKDAYNAPMICEELQKRGVERIGFYHGQMRPEERRRVEQEFLSGKLQVLVATKAFGMGIDLPKLGFIIHFYPPLSLEDYWQEAGRGGRGMDAEKGECCDCVVLYRPEDTEHELLKSLNLISGFSKTLSTFAAVVSGELYWNIQDQLWKAPAGQLRRLLSDLKRRGDIRQLSAIKIGETKLVRYKMLKPAQTIIQHIELFLKGEKKKKGNKGVRRLLSVLRIRAGRKGRIIRVKHSTEDRPFGLDYYDKELNWFTQPGIGALEMMDNEWDPETSEYYSQFRILKNTLSRQEMKELQQRVANYMDEKKWKFECILFNFLGILGVEPSGPPKSVILYYLGLQSEL